MSFVHVVRGVMLRFGFAAGGEIEKKEGCSVARPPAAPSPTQMQRALPVKHLSFTSLGC